MAHPQQESITQFIDQLRQLKSSAKNLLSSVPNAFSRVENGLIQLDNFLCHLTGTPTEQREPTKKFGPIRIDPRPQLPENEIKSAVQMEADQLIHELDEIFPSFADRDPAELVDVLTDLQVRGVAKRAGMKVTDEDPKRITVDYVKQIQQKIRNDRDHVELVESEQAKVEAPKKTKKGAV